MGNTRKSASERTPAAAVMLFALVAGFSAGSFFGSLPLLVETSHIVGGLWLDSLRA
jgi:hypothetical protein